MNINIIPELKQFSALEGAIVLNTFYLTQDVLREMPIADVILKEGTYTGCGTYPIVFESCTELSHPEGYALSISAEKIIIRAATYGGKLYGLMTLSELDRLNDGHLNCCEITDYPNMGYRAISDDISRGQISTFEHFKTIIRRLSRYKYNTYMPYIEDVMRFECCPDWGKYSDGLSSQEWMALVAYAKDYHIQIRPIVNLLGHFSKNASIASLQKITVHTEDGSPTSVIDPLCEAVRPLLSQILDEVIATFGPGIVHVGGDEPCELTGVYGKEKGGQLFIDHYTWLHDELKKRDCSMMMYADFFAPPWGDYAVGLERALELPQGINFVFWDYAPREDYPYVQKLHELGLTVTVSPGTWTWNRFTCDMKVCWENTSGLLRAADGQADHMIMSSWGDGGDCSRELNWPGFLIGANCSWATTPTYTFEDFYTAYHSVFLNLTKEESDALYPLYHYDRVLGLEDPFVFKNEMFKTALEPVTILEKEKAHLLISEMDRILPQLITLKAKTPEKTITDALYLSAQRIRFTAQKITQLPWAFPKSREEAMTYITPARSLASDLAVIRHYHEKVWFDTNRRSDWTYVEMLYLDLEADLLRLARHCANDKDFHYKK